MAKKRVKARKIIKASAKLPNSANILAIIASVLFLLNGIITVFFNGWLINMINVALQEDPALASAYPMLATLTTTFLVSMGLSYLAMSIIIFCVNRMIIKTKDQGWMWGLLIAGILAFFAGRLDASILTIIASIIYLTYKGGK